MPSSTVTHIHRWVIEPPNGPTSLGCCDCGAIKVFHDGYKFGGWGEQEADGWLKERTYDVYK